MLLLSPPRSLQLWSAIRRALAGGSSVSTRPARRVDRSPHGVRFRLPAVHEPPCRDHAGCSGRQGTGSRTMGDPIGDAGGGQRRSSPVTRTRQQRACLTGARPKRHFFAMGDPSSREQVGYCGQPARRRSRMPGGRRSWFRGSVQSRPPVGSGAWRTGEREHRMQREDGPYVPEFRHQSEFSGPAGDAGVGRRPCPRAAGFDSHRRSWQRGVPAAPISTKDLYRAGTRSWRETRLQRLRHSLLRPQQVTAQVPEMRKRGSNHAAEDDGGRAKDRRRK